MKTFFISLLSFVVVYDCNAQLLKNIGAKVKAEVQYRAERKAGQKIDQGLDSILAAPKKIKNKNDAKKKNKDNQTTENNGANEDITNSNPKTTDASFTSGNLKNNNDLTTQEGHISMSLSADKIFTGGSINITGRSIKIKNYKQVEITISGATGKNVKLISLAADGKFITVWHAHDKAGEYTITVKSSDKKAMQSATVTVYCLPQLSNWADDNITITNKAYDRLKECVAKVNTGISPKNKAELEKKLTELKEKKEAVLQLFKDLNTAGKETAALAQAPQNIPPNLAANLSDLNDSLVAHAQQTKKIIEIAKHEPQDNTICEYLVMVNEACAAFSTFTNLKAASFGKIIKNIILDKAVPKAAGEVNEAAGGISAPMDFPLKEMSKIYATSKFDAQSLTEKLGKAGIAGDVVQFASDVLLKAYCGVFTGNFTHNYNVNFRNSKGQSWWKYAVEMKAALSLRYPKTAISTGAIIKMKGNLEGNGTNFTFFEDIEKEDGFQDGTKGKIEVIPINTFIPLSVSFATSEKDILGFGAIARGLATPAYFNIPIDAEYNVDAGKIKIFINAAIIDFTDLVANQFVFLLVGADLLPRIKKMNFPIHKAEASIGGVVRSNNEFTINKDTKGNLSFSGKGNRHIGDKVSVRETDLNFTITAKKE